MRALVVVALAGCWMNSEPTTTPIAHDRSVHTVRAGHAEPIALGTGLLEGVITDIWTGMPLAGIKVELVARTTQKKRSTLTDLNGYYAFARLAPDVYECDLVWDVSSSTLAGAPIRARRLNVQRRATIAIGDGAEVQLDVTADTQNANVFFGP
jgi:hypothetical protein